MATHISKSPEETIAMGRAIGEAAQVGWVIGLKGDLGAGKTQLVRGVAQGLGSTERVHSPTFALINEYRGGRLPIYHIDLYRLETREAIDSAGLDDYFRQTDGVTLIEWFERLENVGSGNIATRVLRFDVTKENERTITDENPGA